MGVSVGQRGGGAMPRQELENEGVIIVLVFCKIRTSHYCQHFTVPLSKTKYSVSDWSGTNRARDFVSAVCGPQRASTLHEAHTHSAQPEIETRKQICQKLRKLSHTKICIFFHKNLYK